MAKLLLENLILFYPIKVFILGKALKLDKLIFNNNHFTNKQDICKIFKKG